jgi:hypothetical protein
MSSTAISKEIGSPARSWKGFLRDLRAGIEELRKRVDDSRRSQDDQPPVRRAREDSAPRAGQIAIGRGHYADGDADIADAGICLNNKAVSSGAEGKWYDSVTALTLDPPLRIAAAWKSALGEATPPQDFLRRYVLLVQDASPDSCLGLVLFLARVNEVALPAEIGPMIAHVRAWERGMSYGIDRPDRCYGVLHNALVHRWFESSWGDAWVDGLSLCVAALESGSDPMNIVSLAADAGRLGAARAYVAYEREAYLDTLRQGEMVQLLLPMQGRLGRFRMVDALIATEASAIGADKIFVRNDREHAWFRDGFAVFALHRPPAVGDGGDVTISATPEVGIELSDLWRRLEELEDEAWHGARPNDDPRAIHLYPGGRRPGGGANSPNQPWYISRDETLIGAPYGLPSHPAGTKLSWQTICETLWSTYNPYAQAIVEAPNGGTLLLHEFPPETARDETATSLGRHLAIASWVTMFPSAPGATTKRAPYPLQPNPTLERYLAACIQRWSRGAPAAGSNIRLVDLPDERGLTTVTLNGGFAVICREGAFILNDPGAAPVHRSDIRHEFENACAILKTILDETDKIGRLVRDVEAHLGPRGRSWGLDDMGLLLRLSRMRTRIMTKWAETMNQTLDADSRRFRDALHEAWGIRGRLEDFYRAVDEVSSILQRHSELQTNRLIARLTVYGYPLALAAAFFGFVFSDLGTKPSDFWQDLGAIRWNGVILYCVLALAGILLIHFVHKASVRRRWKKHVHEL